MEKELVVLKELVMAETMESQLDWKLGMKMVVELDNLMVGKKEKLKVEWTVEP